MNAIMRRINSGKRWWAGEIIFRLLGLALLALCAAGAAWLYRSANQPPAHEPRPAEYLAALATVHGWALGWPFLIEGPALFKLVPVPRGRGTISFATQGNPR